MTKKNCWEYTKCGRQPGGSRENEFGPCPAALEVRTNGINNGLHGGRSCWVIPETLCKDERVENLVHAMQKCVHCEFYTAVLEEENGNYCSTVKILEAIRQQQVDIR